MSTGPSTAISNETGVVSNAPSKKKSKPPYKWTEMSLESGWRREIGEQLSLPYFDKLHEFLAAEQAKRKCIFPPPDRVFAAFELCPFEKLRVVILGQDP